MSLTDLQKKDELRRELRLLSVVIEEFQHLNATDGIGYRLLAERIEDIKKALED